MQMQQMQPRLVLQAVVRQPVLSHARPAQPWDRSAWSESCEAHGDASGDASSDANAHREGRGQARGEAIAMDLCLAPKHPRTQHQVVLCGRCGFGVSCCPNVRL